ncbi:MAG TPA: hypothetical protein PLO56_13555 [Rhodothermales bacterium]|nr:hypothetical protein [Rhodothermales bacterium]
MHESTAIELKLATPTPAQDIEIKVYDLLGWPVKKLKLSEGGVVSYAKII